jgi:hypothetical protein
VNRSKSATKLVDKEFRKMGATRTTGAYGVEYLFPDGSRKFVVSNMGFGAAHQLIHETRKRYGVKPERPPMRGVRVPIPQAPKVDLERLTVTPHAIQRREQMQEQDGLTTLEVALALTCPRHVLWMEQHGTYAWVGERIAVVGHVREGWLTIRTFLWSTNELWHRNPRPEKELIS